MRPALVLTMPLPPTTDYVTGGWRKRALAEISVQRPTECAPLSQFARVRVLVGVVHGRALVEIIAAALGILVDVGVIERLGVISDIEMRWDRTVEPGRMRLELARAVPPLRRIGAATRERIRARTAERLAREREAFPVAGPMKGPDVAKV
jgi:hypothetical protein